MLDFYVQRLVDLHSVSPRPDSVIVWRGNDVTDGPVFINDVSNLATGISNLVIIVMLLRRLKAFFLQKVIDSFS